MTVASIITRKGRHVPTVSPEAKMRDAVDVLASANVGALVVSDDGERIQGIISERDVARGLKRYGGTVLDLSVRELMSENVVTCQADEPVAGIMSLMSVKRIRHVPVVEDGKLAGIVSIHDLIELRLDQVQAEAEAMRSYIAKG